MVFFPETDPTTVYVTMELPLGTSIERTDEVSREVEKIIKETIEPVNHIVKSVTTNVGVGKGGMFDNETICTSYQPEAESTTSVYIEYCVLRTEKYTRTSLYGWKSLNPAL